VVLLGFLVASYRVWLVENTRYESETAKKNEKGPEIVLIWGYPPGEDELPSTEWDKKLLLENRSEFDAYNLETSLHAGSQITATFEPVKELKRGDKQRLDVHLTGVPQGHERDFAMLYYNDQRAITSLPADCVERENGEIKGIKIPMDVKFSGYGDHPRFCTHFRFVASYGLRVKAGVEMLHSERLP
jgi:hypothetical protein